MLGQAAAEWIVRVYAALRNDDLALNQKRVRCLSSFTPFYQ